ncbi:MAG: EAL domain-containing protein [Lachnospiraceae bacterium]|nr:EAL domain-containing protein [Lachnospiraceae bacterium]
MLNYYPQYCIAAVIATLVLLMMYLMKKNYKTRSNKLFFILIIDNLLASSVNITTFYAISFPERYPLWACYLSNYAYLFFFNMMAIIFLLYVDSLTKIPSIKKVVRWFAAFLIICDCAILFPSSITRLGVYFDENLVYRHGPLMFILYVTAFCAIAVGYIIFLRKRKKFNRYQIFSISFFIVGVLASIIFQIYHPKHVINNFTCSMVLFFLYTAFENQAYYLFGDTPCYNRRAFVQTVHTYMKSNTDYTVFAIAIEDFDNIIHVLGRAGSFAFSERIAERLSKEFGREAYYIDEDMYAIVIEKESRVEGVTERIKKCASSAINVELNEYVTKINTKPIITVIPVKNCRVDGYEITDILDNLEEHSSGTIVYMDDFSKRVDALRREKDILRILDRAIKYHSFKVYYQPILNIETGKFCTSEALVRLIDDELGFISPEEFIPIAEKNGRVSAIGDFVVEDVLRFIKENNIGDQGLKYIEINLSPAQFRFDDLEEKLLHYIESKDISYQQLNFEITETEETGSADMNIIRNVITNLHSKGITFSLDDFGSGFAAIDYLIKLPVDLVKIDKMILWQAMEDPLSQKVLANTIRMIKEIGKKIVVEGVETNEMAHMLNDLGVDYLQGYLYSKPIPEAKYLEFLAENKDKVIKI